MYKNSILQIIFVFLICFNFVACEVVVTSEDVPTDLTLETQYSGEDGEENHDEYESDSETTFASCIIYRSESFIKYTTDEDRITDKNFNEAERNCIEFHDGTFEEDEIEDDTSSFAAQCSYQFNESEDSPLTLATAYLSDDSLSCEELSEACEATIGEKGFDFECTNEDEGEDDEDYGENEDEGEDDEDYGEDDEDYGENEDEGEGEYDDEGENDEDHGEDEGGSSDTYNYYYEYNYEYEYNYDNSNNDYSSNNYYDYSYDDNSYYDYWNPRPRKHRRYKQPNTWNLNIAFN